jgi:hypothetical protein
VGYRSGTEPLRPIQHQMIQQMKTNSDTPRTVYIGLDVHKEKTSVAILGSKRDEEPRYHGEINTSQHALERTMRRIAKQQERELSELHVCNV